MRDCSSVCFRGLKLPGTLNESATELLMSQKEHLAEWVDSENRMVIKIQREGHTLQRCLVADCRGKTFPLLMELAADRSHRNHRPRPQKPNAAAAGGPGGTGGRAEGRRRPGPLARQLGAMPCLQTP